MKPKEAYDVLKAKRATHLHHANTVLTSCTFLENGGLLSRGFVATHRLKQTPQTSDAIDKKYGIWDDVFLDHVDIHYRGGRSRGPNYYGPVLFVLDLDVLLELPAGSVVRVTRKNPANWSDDETDAQHWYATAADLEKDISFGDYDKMLVIRTPNGRIDFPRKGVQIKLDDPVRKMNSGADAYEHAKTRLMAAAKVGRVKAVIDKHECQTGCVCEAKYKSYQASWFNSRFA